MTLSKNTYTLEEFLDAICRDDEDDECDDEDCLCYYCGSECCDDVKEEDWDEEDNNPVYHPKHYNTGKIEVIDFIEDQKFNYYRGNAVKYISRAGKKDKETEIQDLEKAVFYLEREIGRLEKFQGVIKIPQYEYRCAMCGKTYQFICTVRELDETKPKVCECGCDKLNCVLSGSKAIWKCGGSYEKGQYIPSPQCHCEPLTACRTRVYAKVVLQYQMQIKYSEN